MDTLDIGKFHAEGLLHLNDAASIREDETYDFYVFNWHFVTMASDIDPLAIKRLPVPKFTVVLELAPGDPLMLVPREVFDGYMVLDPTAEENGRLVAFPRPLEMDGREGRVFRGAVPTIGSFGFGTPAKGFELLVEAVNREFDKAIVRINIPHGQYVETDIIHRMPYAERVKDVCRQIAKPGIEVSFTNEFLSPTELVQWCTQNDLNCFMYTRALPGLSATTDQCIISGQPLLTLTNDTFRHIHRYIEPYPFQGLRKAIATTGKTVRLIQQEWSKERFQDKFHQMLSDAGIITMPHIEKCVPHIAQTDSIFVISRNSPGADNPFDYARKIANSIGRSRQHQIRHISYESAVETLASLGPSGAAGIVFVDYDLAACIQLDAIVSTLPCRKIIIPRADELRETEYPYTWANVVIIPRLPIIPFHTTSAGLKTPARIVLLGFSANSALLQEIIQKVLGEVPTAEVVVECDAPDPAAVAKKGTAPSGEAQPHVSWAFLKSGDRSLPDYFGESSLIIANNDPARTQELESLISIAMVTERPVVFTRRGVFPQLLGRELYVEDHSIAEIIRMGMAAHIKVLYDFGEWTFATALRRILDESWRPTISPVPDNAIVALSPAQFLQVAALGTGVTVTGHEKRVHFRH
ncbi:MAG: hypothetical protein JO001_19140, partial [Alphaproteobacteria bacterium]|nr:hypothetical protein [Alphaproteobacteria bacterium]